MILQKVESVVLTPAAPFAFDATFHKPDHFSSGDNCWQPGVRWQTWFSQGRQVGLKCANLGTVDDPHVGLEVYADFRPDGAFLETLLAEVRWRFNFDLDLSPFYAALGGDPVIGPAIGRWRGMRPGQPSSLYEYLIVGIVLQNATVRRSIQMFRALLEHYGTLLDYDGQALWCFWQPGSLGHVTEDDLRALKVGYRAKSIKRVDDQFAQGLIDERALRQQDRETQRKELLKLYGIGPATVWYILADVFHRWDFFDHVSPWEQKIYSRLFFDADPETPVPVAQLLDHFQRYGDYKQLAVHYLWEDLWWQRKNERIPWLEALIRV